MLAPSKPRIIRAARGSTLSARTWMTEAPLRMLMNNLDPEVAENPAELVVYGGIGRAARDWNCYDRIVETLKPLTEEETLLVQSGKPVGVFPTHADAPRVLIANSNLVPHWATWEHFHELDRKGLAMFGQMTAGSWIYIGSQGIVQGTYETFAEMGRRAFRRTSSPANGYSPPDSAAWEARSRWPRPWPASACWRSNAAKAASPSAWRPAISTRRRRTLDEALDAARGRQATRQADLGRRCSATSSMCSARCSSAASGPDALTDQTSAHDPVNGYLPQGWTRRAMGRASRCRIRRAPPPPRHRARWPSTSSTCCASSAWGCRYSTTATTSGRSPWMPASARAFDIPGFVPEYIRPLFCRGVGPFRWVALSGDPEDIYKTDAKVKELIPDDPHLHHWLDMARSRIHFQGLPARICWVGLGPAASPGPGVQRNGRRRRALGADRDRPRSPGLRFGGQPEPRDRGDARRFGRRLGLAAAQRPAEYRRRRHLGVDSSRRRRRHGILAACRRGHRLRRQRRRGQAHSSACCGTTPAPASCVTPTPATRSPSTARASRA